MTVRFGSIGAGRMGANIARHLAYTVDSANLVAIADPNQQQLIEMRPLFENVDTYSDYNKLLAPDYRSLVTPRLAGRSQCCCSTSAGYSASASAGTSIGSAS